jgi:hypothetical protein
VAADLKLDFVTDFSMNEFVSLDALRILAVPDALASACICSVGACVSWEGVPGHRWPKESMERLGTLRESFDVEPGFEEFHLNGSRYESEHAPIAPSSFPYNRCDLYRCGECCRVLLKYTEAGGYYVEDRVRLLQVELIVDA